MPGVIILLFFIHCESQSIKFFGRKKLHTSYFYCKTGFREAILEIWPAFVSRYHARMRSLYSDMS